MALDFHGQAFVTVPGVALQSAATLEAWVRPRAQGRSARRTIIQQPGAYALYGSDERGRATATVGRVKLTGPKLRARRWTHLALTFDGEKARLLVDGRVVATKHAVRPSAVGDLTIGRAFRGQIDEVAIYAQALTAGELRRDMLRLL